MAIMKLSFNFFSNNNVRRKNYKELYTLKPFEPLSIY